MGNRPGIHVPLDHLRLTSRPSRAMNNSSSLVSSPLLVATVDIAQARAIDRDHTERAGLPAEPNWAIAALEQSAIGLQTAAHAEDHVRLQLKFEFGSMAARYFAVISNGVLAVPGKSGVML